MHFLDKCQIFALDAAIVKIQKLFSPHGGFLINAMQRKTMFCIQNVSMYNSKTHKTIFDQPVMNHKTSEDIVWMRKPEFLCSLMR